LGVFGLKSKEIRIHDLGSQLCIELGNGKDQWKKINGKRSANITLGYESACVFISISEN